MNKQDRLTKCLIYNSQAQSDMEARVAQVASEVRRLQEAECRANNALESRSGSGADRMVQLQEQLTALTQQRLQHLETIQGQQLELQVLGPAHLSTWSSEDL